MNSAILGSRQLLCINSELDRTSANIHGMCKSKVKKRDCPFFNNLEQLKGDKTFMANFEGKVLDIEDLVALGTEHKFCPYYMSQEMTERADIIFSPYNYILDEKTRCGNKTISNSVSKAIIIFDEAHNVPEICEDFASIVFTSDEIVTALADVKYVSKLVSNTKTTSSDCIKVIANSI